MEFKFHSSLHPSCHHHVTFEKFNLRIHYPPPYGILPPPPGRRVDNFIGP